MIICITDHLPFACSGAAFTMQICKKSTQKRTNSISDSYYKSNNTWNANWKNHWINQHQQQESTSSASRMRDKRCREQESRREREREGEEETSGSICAIVMIHESMNKIKWTRMHALFTNVNTDLNLYENPIHVSRIQQKKQLQKFP